MRNFRYFLRVEAVLVGVSTRLDLLNKAIFFVWQPSFLKDKLVIHVLVDQNKIYFDHLAHLLCRHVNDKMLSYHSESQPVSDISIGFPRSGKILVKQPTLLKTKQCNHVDIVRFRPKRSSRL